MKKFKIHWTENDDGDHFSLSRVYEAETEDEACDEWERDVEPYVNTSGIDDCVEVIEHTLENSKMQVEMLDGKLYLVPIMFIAKHKANKESLDLVRVLDMFQEDSYLITSYASRNIEWKDIQRVAFYVEKSYTLEQYQKDWEQVYNPGHKTKII